MEIEQETNYLKYRGKCKELSEEACFNDPSLKLIRGHYYCPIWNSEEPHWWTEREDGSILDPTKAQFPSNGLGFYTPFSGTVECSECGKSVKEEEASYASRYCFCSYECHGRFIGLL